MIGPIELLNNGKPSMFKDMRNTWLTLHFIVIMYFCMVLIKSNLWYRKLESVLIFLGIVCVRNSVRAVRGHGKPKRIKIFNNSSTALK